MGTEVVVSMKVWGTWEELVLGGAVLRHGTRNWAAVASELRTRSPYPCAFTPEACKAKYKDSKRRFSGCKSWFEELRKRRVAELKKALELSEDSIGSLQFKIETLKHKKEDFSHLEYGSNQMESTVPSQKFEGFESSRKEASKDGLSAGSFTLETRTCCLPEHHIPLTASSEEVETKPDVLESFEKENISESFYEGKHSEPSKEARTSTIENLAGSICGGQLQGVKRRRGKRKRKDCYKDAEEGKVEESKSFAPSSVATVSWFKDSSMQDCGQTVIASSGLDSDVNCSGQGEDDLMGILDSLLENERILMFQHRLDSQKRAKYKKLVRRHMDLDTIRSRISCGSLSAVKELFRDVLLLTNNALVFYSKRSREHKTAKLLRELVTRSMRQHSRHSTHQASNSLFPTSRLCSRPVKPRSARPYNCKVSEKLANTASSTAVEAYEEGKGSAIVKSPPLVELVRMKKGSSLQGKSGCGTAGHQIEPTAKRRKTAKRR